MCRADPLRHDRFALTWKAWTPTALSSRYGATPASVLRGRRHRTELRPGRGAAAHRRAFAVPADQGARTRPRRPPLRPRPPLGHAHRMRRVAAAAGARTPGA